VREQWPDQAIHLSVQSNVVNYASVKFWQSMGISRIILSREMALAEVLEIRQQCPDIELEVFVHGALCMAYSGRCLLSGYMNNRDANQGGCSNACRWKYQVSEVEEGDQPSVAPMDTHTTLLLEKEEHDPNAMILQQDEHGSYMLNSKDLRAIHFIDELTKMKVDCFKIEGRTKSHFYVARTAQLYRQAIDDAVAGKPFDPSLYYALEGLANRGYTEGFFARHRPEDYQSYDFGSSQITKQQFCAEVIDYDAANDMLVLNVKNKFSIGDELELMTPNGNEVFTLAAMESEKGQAMSVAPGSGYTVKIPNKSTSQGEFGLLMRSLL
jgi:U32 family peptidase